MDSPESGKEGLPQYEKQPTKITEEKMGQDRTRRKSSVVSPEVLTGEIYDERFDSTKRGLKSRHAQMIALGGEPPKSFLD